MSQVEPVRREGELWNIRAQAGLSVVSIVAVDVFFHFFYILTIPNDLKFASRLPDSALGERVGPKEGTGTGPPHPPERQTFYVPKSSWLGALTARGDTEPIQGGGSWT